MGYQNLKRLTDSKKYYISGSKVYDKPNQQTLIEVDIPISNQNDPAEFGVSKQLSKDGKYELKKFSL